MNNMDYEKKFDNQNNYGWATTLNLSNKFPAISKRIFNTVEDAQSFVDNYNDSAIEGLILTVVSDKDDKNGAYFVEKIKKTSSDNNGVLKKIGEIDLTPITNKLAEYNRLINNNSQNINEIEKIIGELENDETISSLIAVINDKINVNIENINNNKVEIDNYTINNKKISKNPILNSDDLNVSDKYLISGITKNIIPNDDFTTAISKLENALTNVSLTVSASLNDLEHEINNLKNIINTNWEGLISLRNNSQLIPGCKYRIIDYVTTTGKNNTISNEQPFDVIVEALTNNSFSETAKACLHEGDTYFPHYNAKPETWEIKYCIDNDLERFDWATSNGKGVIYYMKDEWGNEGNYDFKNIKINNLYKFDVNGQDGSLINKISILQ